MSKHHFEDIPSNEIVDVIDLLDDEWWAEYEFDVAKHRKPDLPPPPPKDLLAPFRGNIEANRQRFSPNPHASIAAAVMQLSGRPWTLEWQQ